MNIAGIKMSAEVFISPQVSEPMLGIRWLTDHGILWDFPRGLINISGRSVQLNRRKAAPNCRKVTLSSDIIVPSMSEMNIPG